MRDDYPAIQSWHDLRMGCLGLLILVIRIKALSVLLELLG